MEEQLELLKNNELSQIQKNVIGESVLELTNWIQQEKAPHIKIAIIEYYHQLRKLLENL
jgi:hypothetical protein